MSSTSYITSYREAVRIVIDRAGVVDKTDLIMWTGKQGPRGNAVLKKFYEEVMDVMGPNWGRVKTPTASARGEMERIVVGYKCYESR